LQGGGRAAALRRRRPNSSISQFIGIGCTHGPVRYDSTVQRLLILASKLGYQTRGFAEAARRLGVEVVFATDRCHQLDDPWRDAAIAVHFEDPRAAATSLAHTLAKQPVQGIIALGDRPTATAARTAQRLGLPYNSPTAVEACRSKLTQREILRDAGLPVPPFFSFPLDEDLAAVLPRVTFPSVVKPLTLSGSQGVIRANNEAEFTAAVARLRALLRSPEVQVTREPWLDRVLVEQYIPGVEVAVEGLLENGRLRVLAIFDKPDPLEGPYFEETIYVTPSRLPTATQQAVLDCLARTVRALDLTHGPLHAEFRWNDAGPWVLEVSPRPIGGLCSRALKFVPPSAGAQQAAPQRETVFLEELLVRHALRLPGADWAREARASGVMMIPIPRSGILQGVAGEDAARAVPGVEELHITARLHDYIAAWPEGSSYLGFIFARAETPAAAEAALRAAHAQLKFTIAPRLAVEHPLTGGLPRL